MKWKTKRSDYIALLPSIHGNMLTLLPLIYSWPDHRTCNSLHEAGPAVVVRSFRLIVKNILLPLCCIARNLGLEGCEIMHPRI